MKATTITEAKARFSGLIEEVAHAGRGVLITKHGRPMAKLVPVDFPSRLHLAGVKGWLDENDPFFQAMDKIFAESAR